MKQNRLSPRFQPIFDHVVSIAAALLVVFFVRSSFYESYKIPSGSMIPTILIGDHVFVNKFAYGFNLPFSEYFGNPIRLIERPSPKAGEIIVFESPRSSEINYIKRVVGVEGDVVRIRDRRLFINDQEVFTSEPTPEESKDVFRLLRDPKFDESGMRVLKESVANHEHWLLLDGTSFVSENFGPYSVPTGHVFVMGDNRDFSDDSRFIGAIPIDKVRGRATRIWLSIWIHFHPAEFDFRPLRTGKSLDSL
ncbi:MAG: signal peptidase I [Cryobacterium sp.]|nr:signal peptidase I [Oligoflexia bacterium]